MIERAVIAKEVDALLPQTQCEQCGYPGCRPYAEAIAQGHADINQCPPGGQTGVDALAQLLGLPTKALNRKHGEPKPPRVAWIDEAVCIGCTKCIQACPVDAIVGAQKLMHTVIAEECTGCDLCLAPCPVDCIEMHPTSRDSEPAAKQKIRRDTARTRFERRGRRLSERKAAAHARREQQRAQRRARDESAQANPPTLPDRASWRAIAEAAMARARARRKARYGDNEL